MHDLCKNRKSHFMSSMQVFSWLGTIILGLKMNCERSEQKKEGKISVWGLKNRRSGAFREVRTGAPPPSGSDSDYC